MLADIGNSGRLAELLEIEQKVVLTAIESTSQLVAAHAPLVVGIRFDPSWFGEHRVDCFLDRDRFKAYGDIYGPERADMFLGSYRKSMFRRHGSELPSIRDIPASGHFPAVVSSRTCPGCPAFFICVPTPAGALQREFT